MAETTTMPATTSPPTEPQRDADLCPDCGNVMFADEEICGICGWSIWEDLEEGDDQDDDVDW